MSQGAEPSKVRVTTLTLNVDCDRNTDKVEQLLSDNKPEVACLQEVLEIDLPRLAAAMGAIDCFFVPMTRVESAGVWYDVGVCVLSKFPLQHKQALYYVGSAGTVHNLDRHDPASRREVEHRILLVCDVEKNGVKFTIATTHFTWVPDGKPDNFQREDMRRLLELLSRFPRLVLYIDVNAARGGKIFSALAAQLKDNVPLGITTSIDPERHRVTGLYAMVDGIFSQGYYVENVGITFGPSDHGALSATISTDTH